MTHSSSPGQRGDATLAHRELETTLTVRTPGGAPLAGVEVTFEQVGHAFGFGNIGFDFVDLANRTAPASAGGNVFGGADPDSAAALVDLWLDVFNTATLPFYWSGFEAERGQPDTERLRTAARWFRDRGVAVKGHPLVWHTRAPAWLAELPVDEAEQVVRARVRLEVSAFEGLIGT